MNSISSVEVPTQPEQLQLKRGLFAGSLIAMSFMVAPAIHTAPSTARASDWGNFQWEVGRALVPIGGDLSGRTREMSGMPPEVGIVQDARSLVDTYFARLELADALRKFLPEWTFAGAETVWRVPGQEFSGEINTPSGEPLVRFWTVLGQPFQESSFDLRSAVLILVPPDTALESLRLEGQSLVLTAREEKVVVPLPSAIPARLVREMVSPYKTQEDLAIEQVVILSAATLAHFTLGSATYSDQKLLYHPGADAVTTVELIEGAEERDGQRVQIKPSSSAAHFGRLIVSLPPSAAFESSGQPFRGSYQGRSFFVGASDCPIGWKEAQPGAFEFITKEGSRRFRNSPEGPIEVP